MLRRRATGRRLRSRVVRRSRPRLSPAHRFPGQRGRHRPQGRYSERRQRLSRPRIRPALVMPASRRCARHPLRRLRRFRVGQSRRKASPGNHNGPRHPRRLRRRPVRGPWRRGRPRHSRLRRNRCLRRCSAEQSPPRHRRLLRPHQRSRPERAGHPLPEWLNRTRGKGPPCRFSAHRCLHPATYARSPSSGRTGAMAPAPAPRCQAQVAPLRYHWRPRRRYQQRWPPLPVQHLQRSKPCNAYRRYHLRPRRRQRSRSPRHHRCNARWRRRLSAQSGESTKAALNRHRIWTN